MTRWRIFTLRRRSANEESVPDPHEDGPISDAERLSRFVFDRRGFAVSKKTINYRQFLPPKTGEYSEEVSVMRTEGLAENAVWALGQKLATGRSGRRVQARGDFAAPAVRSSRVGAWQLNVRPSVPPRRHALIVGWPPASERDARKSLAQQLRRDARLVVA